MPSGSLMLDLVLGGNGWPFGRMCNLVGDKSTGKTLLAIEACANAARSCGVLPGDIRYAEAEAAFDEPYAETVGYPQGTRLTKQGEIQTVEDFSADLKAHLARLDGKRRGMYVLDSFDSLSSRAEMAREVGDATYGQEKAKLGSELFRTTIDELATKNCLLLIVSQIRDKIGVTFGETKQRSGGHALDFYASNIVWLAQTQMLTRTVSGIKRTYGVNILAKNKKCKVGPPFRYADLTLLFNYGIDDEFSMLNWLKQSNTKLILTGEEYSHKDVVIMLADMRDNADREGLLMLNRELRQLVIAAWQAIDNELRVPIRKYG